MRTIGRSIYGSHFDGCLSIAHKGMIESIAKMSYTLSKFKTSHIKKPDNIAHKKITANAALKTRRAREMLLTSILH